MKLILKNFRCFSNLELTIPDKGLVLLYGDSGVGKSSIIKAIHFCLFGKEQKVIAIGQKSCSVEMEIDDWKIIRTKNPSHLTLITPNGKVEDDVAKQMIISRFGEHFLLTNYIAQKSVNSFFALSNVDKTTFLHQLTMQQFDINSFKGRLKNKIKDRRNNIISISSEIAIYESMIDQEEMREGRTGPG